MTENFLSFSDRDAVDDPNITLKAFCFVSPELSFEVESLKIFHLSISSSKTSVFLHVPVTKQVSITYHKCHIRWMSEPVEKREMEYVEAVRQWSDWKK